MERATELVVELLSKNISAAEVARITGNTESAISQVKNTYIDKIAKGKADASLASGCHGKTLDRLEALVASKLEAVIDLETDSMKIAKIFQTLNSAVRRDSGETGGAGGNTVIQTVVQLEVPQHLRQPVAVQVNSSNDVVSVAGRDLTPASIGSVKALAGLAEEQTHEEVISNTSHDEIMQVFVPGLDSPT